MFLIQFLVLPLVLIVLCSILYIKDSGPPAVDLTYSSVRGRLRKFADFWPTLELSQFILNNIMQGYKIPFFSTPNTLCEKKQQFCT